MLLIQSVHACYTYIYIHIYIYIYSYMYLIYSSGAKHIRRVLQYVEEHNLVSRWRRIGIELEITNSDLDITQRDRDSVEDRAVAMLDQWLASGSATKQALVEAVWVVKK